MEFPDLTHALNHLHQQNLSEAQWQTLYLQLKGLAQKHMAHERKDHTLQATALVNQAYLEILNSSPVPFQGRQHFLAYASEVMRHILAEHARRNKAQKRGGGWLRISLSEPLGPQVQDSHDFADLDEALNRLAKMDERKARIVVWRFFGGLSIEEIAELCSLSVATIHAELKKARGWLYHELAS
ncbi:MAG: sigma-70 family RNA polymerase sigma factor [Acidobacteria bacterium]|nr:sigma-70 family RNA polymerase sigma factor [Acidobacteriota bacterium]MCB9399299.1 sigma-70 family RNA polymerase sigma factor [Acidobacteriota bacterium]